jgi:WD40 repeat protein
MDPVTKELSDAAKARCVDVKPSGEEVAVGFLDGSVRIYAFPSFEEKKRFQAVKKLAAGKNQVLAVSQVRYSPNSSLLAVASHDAKVHIYSTVD